MNSLQLITDEKAKVKKELSRVESTSSSRGENSWKHKTASQRNRSAAGRGGQHTGRDSGSFVAGTAFFTGASANTIGSGSYSSNASGTIHVKKENPDVAVSVKSESSVVKDEMIIAESSAITSHLDYLYDDAYASDDNDYEETIDVHEKNEVWPPQPLSSMVRTPLLELL
jgi:hypothetical protein